MDFEKNHLYHIFNQGNNQQTIFFKEDNYLFFIQKIKTHICPFADLLAWCLMPNHFHLMVRVNDVELPTSAIIGYATQNKLKHPAPVIGSATSSRAPNRDQAPNNRQSGYTSLNKEIGILLASYTRAIQKQENITGTLFRQKTKAECLNEPSGLTPSFYNTRQGTLIHIDNPEKYYPQVCFNYIHQNPVKARLVKHPEDWEFSSYRDVVGLRNGTLINRDLIQQLELKSECDSKSRPD